MLERKTELKRGDKPLRADPAKTRDWQDRSRKPLPQASKKRKVGLVERRRFAREVLKERPRCEAQLVGCTGKSSEVNELQRGPARRKCWLDREKVTALCSACHRFITHNPDWAYRHGHQLPHEREVTTKEWLIAKVFRKQLSCGKQCPIDHWATEQTEREMT